MPAWWPAAVSWPRRASFNRELRHGTNPRNDSDGGRRHGRSRVAGPDAAGDHGGGDARRRRPAPRPQGPPDPHPADRRAGDRPGRRTAAAAVAAAGLLAPAGRRRRPGRHRRRTRHAPRRGPRPDGRRAGRRRLGPARPSTSWRAVARVRPPPSPPPAASSAPSRIAGGPDAPAGPDRRLAGHLPLGRRRRRQRQLHRRPRRPRRPASSASPPPSSAVGAAAGGSPARTSSSPSPWPAAWLGFLPYNRHPARTFMGDSGSMFIGFLLAGACVLAQGRVGTVRGLALPAVALSVPLLDTALTFVRRGVLQRRSLFAAERGHVHHRLMDIGLFHPHVVYLLWLVTLAGAGVALTRRLRQPVGGPDRRRRVLLRPRRPVPHGRQRPRPGHARGRPPEPGAGADQPPVPERRSTTCSSGSGRPRTVDAWLQQVCRAAEVLDFAKLNLPLARRDGTGVGPPVAAGRGRAGESSRRPPVDHGRGPDPPAADRPSCSGPRSRSWPTTRWRAPGRGWPCSRRLMGEYGLDKVRPTPSGRPGPGPAPATPGRWARGQRARVQRCRGATGTTDPDPTVGTGPAQPVPDRPVRRPARRPRPRLPVHLRRCRAGARAADRRLPAGRPVQPVRLPPAGQRGFLRDKP